MIRSAASKVMWVGRATVFLVGLAVILALLFGVVSRAVAHSNADAKLFHLGHGNSAGTPTSLVGTLADAAKSAFIVQNKSGGPALDLRVGNATIPANDVAPMKVNSTKKVSKLNADRIDNREASSFANATHQHSGEDITSGTVEADRIEDGPGSGLNADELDGVDSTQFAQILDSGTTTLDPTTIAAQSCGFLVVDPPGAGDISNDVVVVTPDSLAASTNLVFGASRASQNPNAGCVHELL